MSATVLLICALVPAGIFAVTAYHKLAAPAEFRNLVAEYRIVPAAAVGLVAGALPCMELVAAIGLTLSSLRRGAALLSIALLIIFTSALLINLARGRRDLDCGCHFGKARTPISPGLLVRNAMVALCLIPVAMTESVVRSMHWIEILTVVSASAVGVLAYDMAGSLVALPIPAPTRR